MKLYTLEGFIANSKVRVEAIGENIIEAYYYLYHKYGIDSGFVLLNVYELTDSEFEFLKNPVYPAERRP